MKKFNLPQSSLVNRFVAKSKFYEKGGLTARQQNEFVDKIQKITWKYKLSEDTIGISKTESVVEIQIMEIELKEQRVPRNSLLIIERLIPYKILYMFIYKSEFCYAIHFQDRESHTHLITSDWNQKLEFEFSGLTLQSLYEKLVRKFFPYNNLESLSYGEAIQKFREIQKLSFEIERLEIKVIREKQFNRQVELNQVLRLKREEFRKLVGNLNEE
jgi:hypothetical protein